MIVISLKSQTLYKVHDKTVSFTMPISSAKNGIGQQKNSYKTPLGLHYAVEKFGTGMPENTVFVGRAHTSEIYSDVLAARHPERDWILTRIIRLCGLEPGYNSGGDIDTYQRYIYIHGCPDSCSFDRPDSHGCIRMRNSDIIQLYDATEIGEPIYITHKVYSNAVLDAIDSKLYVYTHHDTRL